MLVIPCPFCGPRDEREFVYGGPTSARRPRDPTALSDSQWVEFLTVPDNPLGPVRERWWHARGCGDWVEILRDTRTHEILREQDG